MGMMEDYAAWKAGLCGAVDAVLETEAADWVKLEMQAQVREKVYGAYTPKEYERRGDEGGMSDLENYSARVTPGSMTLTVENLTVGNSDYAPPESEGWDDDFISDLIQQGTGYHWKRSGIYRNMPFPRPYTEAVEKAVVDSGTLDWALEKGLRERGYDVRKG